MDDETRHNDDPGKEGLNGVIKSLCDRYADQGMECNGDDTSESYKRARQSANG